MSTLPEMLKIQMDFSQSHLFFPAIIEWILAVLLVLIFIAHGRELVAFWRTASPLARIRTWQFDRRRLVGCLILTPVYFALMEPVGKILPNSGIGFLLTSVVFGFALSWLFVHDNNRRKTILMALNALITPTFVWFVFSYLFHITLP